MPSKLGILGGTFDPVHNGHLAVARYARRRMELERVRFLPAFQPPHKGKGAFASPEDRLAMVKLAVEHEEGFEADDLEIRRGGPSYTVQTLREIAAKRSAGEIPCFITGADSLLELPTWKGADEIFRLCRFVAVARPGFDLEQAPEPYRSQAVILTGLRVDISSTDVRKRIAAREPIGKIVPKAVEDYIRDRGLYGNE